LAEHLSRKNLKKDEVRETFAHGAQAVMSHQQLSLYLLIAAVLVAGSIFGWRTYSERQTVKAFAAFDDANKVFQAPVGAPAAPGELSYADSIKKYTDAAQKFSDVAAKYPRTRAGELARYYAALCFENLAKNAEAKEALEKVANSSGDPEIAALGRFELAGFLDRNAQGDDAEKLYLQLMANPTVLVPKPVVMMALAEHYFAKKPAESAKLYTQIKTDYPDTPIAQQADQALSLLPGKS
jgi:TolA-binding protein